MVQTQIWPGWDTVRAIGSGSCGTVYEIRKADDPTGSYRAALKVISIPASRDALRPYLEKGLSNTEIQAALREQAQAAIAALAPYGQLNGCPNIVCYEEHMLVPQQDGIGWSILLRMPLMLPVADYFAKHGLNVKHIQRLGTELCTALERSAAYGLSHGNIKPENILLSSGGEFMLADFGMAAMMKTLGISPNADSYSFMAPEVYRGAVATEASDVYSLGFVLYWLLNDCQVPFLPDGMNKNDPRALAQAHHTRFSAQRLPAPAHGKQALTSAVLNACELDLASRFPSAAAFSAALRGRSEAPVKADPVCAPSSSALHMPNVVAIPTPVQTPKVVQQPKAVPAPTPIPEYQSPMAYPVEQQAVPYIPEPYPVYPENMNTASYDAAYEPPKKKRPVGLIVLLAILIALIIGCGAFLTIHIIDNMESSSGSSSDNESDEGKDDPSEEDGSTEEVVTEEEEETTEETTEEVTEEEEETTEEETEETTTETVSYPSGAVTFNGHHYYMYNCSHASTWEEAKQFCEEQGGHLAIISSREEDQFLYNYMARSGLENAYFGYSDAASEGSWNWVNGEYPTYTNWYPGEPNNYASNEHYAMYYLGYHDGTWNDDNGLIFDLDNAPFVTAKRMSSSSYLTEGATTYDAVSTIDGTPKTAWSEGVSGQGIGETLTMELAQTYNVVGFTIHAGYQFSPDFYNANSRPRVIELIFSDGTSEEVELADFYGPQTIYLNRPVTTTSVTIKIKSVYPGDQFEDTCISEVVFLSGVLNTGFICEWDE